MSRFHLSSTKLNEIQNRYDFRVVWIGSNDVPNDLENFDEHLEKYDTCENCGNDIKEVESEHKFLIILKGFIPETDFENLRQIQSIYVLKEKYQNLEYNRKNHPKVVGIFEDINTLINRLHKDILLIHRDLPISIFPLSEIKNEQSFTKLNGNTLMFLWNQHFIYYLVHPINANMEELKTDMLKQCQLDYNDNKTQLGHIESFGETCSDENALEWYTKDSFLYRSLNKACRTGNIDLMCKFRYFIILLYKNFERLSKSQDKNFSTVYRGQIMNKNELEKLKLNIGSLVSINTILSTSCNEKIARSFILDAEDAVIFKINIPNRNDNSFMPFIDISKSIGISSEEEEVLFFVGTGFSIDSIQNTTDSPCIIELTLNNDPYIHFRKLVSIFAPEFQKIAEWFLSTTNTDYSNNTIQAFINTIIDPWIQKIKEKHHLIMKTDDFNMIEQYYYILTKKQFSSNNDPTIMISIHFAFLLSNLGLYDRAIQIYEQGLSLMDISTKGPEFIVIHIIIGYLYYHLSQYDEADEHYTIVLSLLDEENLLTNELYRYIADIERKRNNGNTSLSYYQKALEIANNRYIPSLQYIYQEIIDILKTQGNYTDADIYERKLKKIDPDKYYISLSTWGDQTILDDCRSRLNNEHEPIKRADLLYKIGLHCVVQGPFEEALEQFLQAKDLYTNQPPSWDRFPQHLSILFDNIAMLYLFSKNYLKALIMFRKAIDIRNSFLSY
ncbi:unnamed protein product [Rotaria sordida]|uniref:NAD(P)(+)--arginine ADP-ribosyltransferase n=1 Tax=Rotaria sordida TaxID=392033 RepID=A0A816AJY8_9BILA|nr:unnamed protein product [Rotaria sordida]CAF1597850.1 unnamed protein product [Rotaria sordida]